MHLFALVALIVWMPIGVYCFRRLSAQNAILVNFFGGWAVLPGALYVPSTAEFPYWILGVCLPASYLLTKATVIGLTGIVGVLLFHSAELRKFRPRIYDIPMAVWCCAPLLSAAGHWSTLGEGLFDASYLTTSWGVPWLLGRVYFSDHNSLLLAAKACVIGGACYVPICLVELCAGPQIYNLLYGYQPYRWVGAGRYLGYRPIGLMEDGNQLGIWMAAATLFAVFLSVRQPKMHILGLSVRWVAAGLACTTLLCQSAGSIILLLLLLPLTLLRRRVGLRISVAVLVLVIVAFVLIRMTGLVPLREMAQRSGPIHAIVASLSSVGRHSVAWRLSRDESFLKVALQHPLLGSGQWNWWQSGDSRPWSLWLLVFGMYGMVGLIAFGLILFLPVLCVVWPSARKKPSDGLDMSLASTALILMVAIDCLLNGAMILPYLLVIAGLASSECCRTGFGRFFNKTRRKVQD
jgi:hypothetical protein